MTRDMCCPDLPARRGEELQCDVVGIAERESRTIGCVNDPTVLDAQLVEPRLPLLEVSPTAARERDMVEARPALVEGIRTVWIREIVEAEQGLATKEPDRVAERTRILLDERRIPDEALVP